MFKKILVANRGEIACRIIKTARKLGIQTVAVYSDADYNSKHVQLATEACHIGDSNPGSSYLNMDVILKAAKKTGAEAIHPGYGFLSENAIFAKSCADNGLVFIGPSVESIETMGSKRAAKICLAAINTPLIPGYHGNDQSLEILEKAAENIGYPVLIKAVHGGGGRGMRLVEKACDFKSMLDSAKREAQNAFGNDEVLLEKYIIQPRHIEVQIFGDSFGNVVHLFERDCSVQRRHQKVIEEAPASNISDHLRTQLTTTAVKIAKAIDYLGAGTIEFVVAPDETFYFIEMNTRLQVEHPVTEAITNVDLVEWQLRVAAGEPLPKSQQEISMHGHAIECRICAEDPNQSFLPTSGNISFLHIPQETEHVRIDSFLIQQQAITTFYDSLLAKLIVTGKTREQACLKMQIAMQEYIIGGIVTNAHFLKSILNNDTFKASQWHTRLLDEGAIKLTGSIEQETAIILAAIVDYDGQNSNINHSNLLFAETWGWQPHLKQTWNWRYLYNKNDTQIFITPISRYSFLAIINNDKYIVSYCINNENASVVINGIEFKIAFESKLSQIILYLRGERLVVWRQEIKSSQNKTLSDASLTAPMPATVIEVLKNVGESVKNNEVIMILEAMKMEHSVRATHSGSIKDIFFSKGATVKEGEVLLELTAQ